MPSRRTTSHLASLLGPLLALILVAAPGCATDGADGPTDEEIAAMDGWAESADGKADAPSELADLFDWLRDIYRNRLSAVWNGQPRATSAAAALAEIRARVGRAGMDAAWVKYRTTVQKLDAGVIDHSEINITLPGNAGVVRLVGDPKGSGAFFDRTRFKQAVGPQLCLTWSELQTAIEAAYLPGAYGVDFVCHTLTEKVLRALDVGTARYSQLFRTYQSARWMWGPVLPSGNSHDPSDWAVSRTCN